LDEIKKDNDTYEQVKNCVTNMVVWADILKKANPAKEGRHGSVDINENK